MACGQDRPSRRLSTQGEFSLRTQQLQSSNNSVDGVQGSLLNIQLTTMHQMTADLGIGANIAIEDATVLCNILHRELKADHNRHPTGFEITNVFAEYQKKRWARAKAFTDLSGQATRMHSYDTLFGRVMATYIVPYLSNMQTAKLAESFAKAPKLDYVPVQTIDENTPGWLLAKKEERASGTPWLMYAAVGAVVTGLAVSRYGLPKL